MSADARAGPKKAKRLIQVFEKKEIEAGGKAAFGDQKEVAQVDAQRLKQSFEKRDEKPVGAVPLRPAVVVGEPVAAVPVVAPQNVVAPAVMAQEPLRPAVMATSEPAKVPLVPAAVVNANSQPGAQKTALIIYAHPEAKSFNHAILEVTEKALADQGYTVNVSDLYSMNFNAVVSKSDIVGDLSNPGHFKYFDEVGRAFAEGLLAEDILSEQDRLEEADLVVFQFPMTWFSFPGILKGWFDRVMCYKFAYGSKQFYDQGRFRGKRAILSFTTRDPESTFTNKGVNGEMDLYLWPLQYGMLRYCGFDVLPPNIVYSPGTMSMDQRKQVLQSWSNRLQKVCQEKPLFFIPLEYFDPNAGFQLDKDTIEKEIAKSDFAPTIGQNLGKVFHSGSMVKEP